MSINAIGYVRSDVSGAHQRDDEERLRAHSKRHGFNLRKTIVFGSHTDDPERRLRIILDNMEGVDAVIVPTAEHFGDEVPAVITERVDIVVVQARTPDRSGGAMSHLPHRVPDKFPAAREVELPPIERIAALADAVRWWAQRDRLAPTGRGVNT